ncbi:MAG: hypothetical protein RL748_973 [Pseudomonadota bacterium]|jgi:iron complex outermembrane receptor protein
MTFQPTAIASALALLFIHPAMAQQAASAEPAQTVRITAHPVIEEVKVDRFSGSAAVVTEAQLRDQNALDAAAALRRTPGVQISRYNPVGAFGGDQGGAVFIRGMGVSRPGSEIKTYIDGMPFYMGVWNHPLLDLLPVNGMRSITVYKSPQPQINGNNFASINLETKRATEDGVHGNARLSAGSFGTVTEQFDLSGKSGDIHYALAQGYAKSSGHRDNASGELKNLMGRLGWKLDANWRIDASLLHVDTTARDPGDLRQPKAALAPEYANRASMFTLGLAHQHGSAQGELRLYSNRGDGDWLHQGGLDGDTRSHFSMSGLRWKEQFSPWSDATLVGGIDLDRIDGDVDFKRINPAPSASFTAPGFKVSSPYIALNQQLALNNEWKLIPSIGLRYYEHNQFKSGSAPHLGLSLVSDNLTLFAQASRGINYPGLEAPVLSSLIAPLGDSWKKLQAEELEHLEFGLKFSPSNASQIDFSLFQDKVKNRYVFGFPPDVPPPPQFLNLGSYRMQGLELSLRQSLNQQWTLFTGLTLLDPSIDNLPYTPKQALSLGLNGQVGAVKLALDAQYQSEVRALNRTRAAGSVNTEQVSAFAVCNARFSYPLAALGKKGEVFVAIENLFDRSYAYRPGYPMPGRWGQVGISTSF